MNKIMDKAKSTGQQVEEKLRSLPKDAKAALTESQRHTRVKLIVAIVIIVLAILIAGGIIGSRHLWYAKKNRAGIAPYTRDDITFSSAPSYISLSIADNEKNDEVVDYLEQDAYLKNIYEGYGFAKDYGSARGHYYTLTDVYKTLRPHALANCLTCKTDNFTRLVNNDGVSVYTRSFEEVYQSLGGVGISCYNCHSDDSGNGGVIQPSHSYVYKALGDNISSVNASVLACGQCHIEYYFTPADKETMMPYSSVETMTPEAILNYYNSMEYNDSEYGFYDWYQESTGAYMLKAQHPEMETFMQGVHAGTLSCADCHMPIEQSYDGIIYHSHYLVSPLENETLLSSCARCHEDTDMVNMVQSIQRRVTAKENQVGNELSAFKNALAAENQKGIDSRFSATTLDEARTLYREAQWFFDFCYVENSEGAHNSDLSMRCLEMAEEKINAGMALLAETSIEVGK